MACERDQYARDAWNERALAAEALGDIGEAAAALFSVGDLLAQATQHARAHAVMERVLELAPDHTGAARMRTWLAGKLSPADPAEAVRSAILARGTLPVPYEAEPDLEQTHVDAETPGRTPETRNFTRATAIANAALVSPMLLSLRSDALVALSRHAAVLDERASSPIYSEGDDAGGVYVAIEGDVTLSRADAPPVTRGPGDMFGAEALLFDGPHAFTAHKPTHGRVLVLGLADVRALIDDDAHACESFVVTATAEIATGFVHRHGFARDLGPEAAADFVARAHLRPVAAGEVIVDHGARPDGLMYVLGGQARLTGSNFHFEPGDPVGAQWVVSGKVATRSIRATVDGWLVVIDRAATAELLAAHPLLVARLTQ